MSGFDPWLERWRLTPDGAEIVTHSSRVLPVLRGGAPAMLKVAHAEEERCGSALMAWYGGDGAARVLDRDDAAVLLERVAPSAGRAPRSLAEAARGAQDDEATRVLCGVAARLHAPRPSPPPRLQSLARWFRALAPAAGRHGGVLAASLDTARTLLSDTRDPIPLHGDIHHDNVLDGGGRGWLAIDPKGVFGERGFDFANMLCNPDAETATAPGRLARQAAIVAEAAGLDRQRLLMWVLAYAGLSAAWTLESAGGARPQPVLTIAEIAAAELRG